MTIAELQAQEESQEEHGTFTLATNNEPLPELLPDTHLTSEQAIDELKKHEFSFLTGVAGSGKSYTLKKAVESGLMKPMVGASTGIAAVNLGTQTINSILKFFDTYSLRQNRFDGKLERGIRRLADTYDALVWDEVSMSPSQQIQIVHDTVAELNHNRAQEGKEPFRLILTGDMCQLPPIPEKGQPVPWAFQAPCWGKFHQVRLTKVYRQTNPLLLDALNAIRAGAGELGAKFLLAAGIQFAPAIDPDFDGTTLVSKNDKVNRFNYDALMKLPGDTLVVNSQHWYEERGRSIPSEWKNIPGAHTGDYSLRQLEFKLGAYVMILSNEPTNWSYVNGDCGWVREVERDNEGEITHVHIELARNNQLVRVGKIVRDVLNPELPSHLNAREVTEINDEKSHPGYLDGQVVKSKKNKRYITGQIEYLPVRLAYATTIHKSQGLSLDRVQIDMTDSFFGNPAMAYVAFSRAKTLEGLRVVGNGKLLAQRVKTDPSVRNFL